VTVREREHALGVEAARLAAVRRYGILDTPPDSAFDRVARLAARLFATPIATVTIVDEQRIWFKARHGLDGLTEIPREPGLCASAILHDEPYLVTDARVDLRTLHHSLVHGELGLCFYAAAPIVTADGHRLGTVNVIDHAPRQVRRDDLTMLQDLAAIVADELALRLAALRTLQAERRRRALVEGERARLEEIAAHTSELAEQLQWALDHRVTIEQAKGILMAREGLDEQAAFERLRGYARSTRQPLEPVAAELIKGQPLPAPVPSGKPKHRRQQSR